MNRGKAVAVIAATLIVCGLAMFGFAQARYQAIYTGRGFGYVLQGYSNPEADVSARLEANATAQPIFGLSYVLLLAGAGAAITAVALRRES